MRKRTSLIITILSLLLLPMIANADMTMGPMTEYHVIVTNKEGTTLVDNKSNEILKIPYQTELIVNGEEKIKGELFGFTNYKEEYGYVKMSDTTLKNKFQLNEDDWYKYETKYYVFESGAKLYKGPGFIYGEIDDAKEIPVGTILDSSYSDGYWSYTEYDNQKGWLYTMSYDGWGAGEEKTHVADISDTERKVMIVGNSVNMYVNPRDKENVSGTIPANTVITYTTYLSVTGRNSYYYVEYNGVKGWIEYNYYSDEEYDASKTLKEVINKISTGKVIQYNDTKLKSYELQNITVYSDYTLSEKLTTIKVNQEFEEVAKFYYLEGNEEKSIALIKANGVYGWIYYTDKIAYQSYSINSKQIAVNEIALYSDFESTVKKDSINLNEEFTTIWTMYVDNQMWNYVQTSRVKGWAKIDYRAYANEPYSEEDKEIILTNDVNIYNEINNGDSITKVIIPKDTKLTVLYKYTIYGNGSDYQVWSFVEYEGTRGWINSTKAAISIPEEIPEEEKPVIDDSELKEEIEEEEKEKDNTAMTIGIAIGCAVVLAISSIVLIKLIKKRKKVSFKDEKTSSEIAEEKLAEENINEAEKILEEENKESNDDNE